MKAISLIIAILIITSTASGAELPFPSSAAGNLYLPFGQQLYETGQKDKVSGFNEPNCSPSHCQWIAERDEGTIILTQDYQGDALVGFGLLYVLTKDEGKSYEQKLRALKEKLGEWHITGSDDLLGSDLNFRAESKDTKVIARFQDGEHSTTIIINITAK